MANILITGGTGFIGSWIVSKLVGDWADDAEKQKSHNVIIVDNAAEGAIMPSLKKGGTQPTVFFYDISTDPLVSIIKAHETDCIIHMAAWASVRESMTNPLLLYKQNVIGTANIVQSILAAREQGCNIKSLVFASSSAASDPINHYGVSKLAGELMLDVLGDQVPGLKVAMIRPANVYGPRRNAPRHGPLIANLIECAVMGTAPIINDPYAVRDFIYVEDAAQAFIDAMAVPGVHNASSGICRYVDDVFRTVRKVAESCGLDLKDYERGLPQPGEKKAVAMKPSRDLMATGWRSKVDLETGVYRQTQWRLKMAGCWDDNHDEYGNVV
jgi:UDP-glucose 4-epimerase